MVERGGPDHLGETVLRLSARLQTPRSSQAWRCSDEHPSGVTLLSSPSPSNVHMSPALSDITCISISTGPRICIGRAALQCIVQATAVDEREVCQVIGGAQQVLAAVPQCEHASNLPAAQIGEPDCLDREGPNVALHGSIASGAPTRLLFRPECSERHRTLVEAKRDACLGYHLTILSNTFVCMNLCLILSAA